MKLKDEARFGIGYNIDYVDDGYQLSDNIEVTLPKTPKGRKTIN